MLHARNEQRGRDARDAVKGAEGVVYGDLSDIDETIEMAKHVNELGAFDCVIHNAGVYAVSSKVITNVNTLAPYILTCLIDKPSRLVYLSSGDHMHGRPNLEAIRTGRLSYADSKLHDVMLSFAVARRWKDVLSNAVDPGWVPTKMGGRGAPDDLDKGYETQSWLAVSDDPKASVSGRYFYHKNISRHNKDADSVELQEEFIKVCGEVTGVRLD
jgi:NAD(P)-dependent dehydrogenase (short-subunit alcohol dehydrogenase family)